MKPAEKRSHKLEQFLAECMWNGAVVLYKFAIAITIAGIQRDTS